MPAAIGNSEHAPDGAFRAADAGADRATYHATDRAGDPVTFVAPSWAPRTMPWAWPA